MTGFDIAVLLVVGFGAVTGFVRGFVEEVLSLLAWIFSLAAIHYLHTPITDFFTPYIGNTSGAAVLAFAVLLLIPYAAIKVLAGWLGRTSRSSVLGPIDRVLGFGFGMIKGVLIMVVAFSVLVLGYYTVWGPKGRPDWITQARTYRFIDASSMALVDMIAQRRQAALDAEAAAIREADARARAKQQGR
jgi:membrane protein required for colicin V production